MSPSEDTRRLATQVVLVLGALALFAAFGFIVLPGVLGEGRVAPIPAAGRPASAAGEGWLDPAEAPARPGRDIPPLDPAEVMTPNPPILESAVALYAQNCVACHGVSGRGDGPSAATLNPRPRNFTEPGGWTNGFRTTDIYKTLTEGIKARGMNPFDYLPPRDRMALVHYVRSLGAFDHGPGDVVAEEALATQFRSGGGRLPNRIPVSLAIEKVIAESSAPAPLMAPAGDGPGVVLFRRVVTDPARAAQTLAACPGWREDLGALARTCVAGAPANGFAPEVALLAPEEWRSLMKVLMEATGR